ncbi:Cdc7p-Dbf4p kinase complex regulatory subunit [Kickxella alabastrina]|uniref:Cdc7p-Dbf4p kinase complex regulatory subunit n=1 Tax=Kickxella alabastrina TaxID=61397 RepID=A0ACC1ITR6_9FUNG|nr:Cdc7p-Dbf4p kinase complex regulatory subunit [Kickxella alabastrina]
MASRKLTFDASRPVTRNLGASPITRAQQQASSQQASGFISPSRALATPTRPSQRASLSRVRQSRRETIAFGTPLLSPAARRNPLQAITEQERQRNNKGQDHDVAESALQYIPRVGGGSKNIEAAGSGAQGLSAEQQHSQQTSRVADWIFAYRRAFPNFVFYFEGIDEGAQQRLAAPIRALGAKVETFFSAQAVTHVIVENSSAIAENSASSSHVVALAKRFQLKIWDVEKLEKRVLVFLLPGFNASTVQTPSVVTAKRKLNEAFSAEKLYAMRHKTFEGAAVSHGVDFYYFKHYYVLVEDDTHLNRPAILEDYRPPENGRDPPWPKLYMVPTGRCPFVQYEDPTTSSKGSDSDGDDNKENVSPEPERTQITAQLLGKVPATRLQNASRRKTWTPSAIRAVETPDIENNPPQPQPLAAPHPKHMSNMATRYDPMVTPTRPSRVLLPANTMMGQQMGARPYDASGVMDSNASGICQGLGVTSTSTAFHTGAIDPVLQHNFLQNLNGGLVTHLSKLEQPVARVPQPQPSTTRMDGHVPPEPRTKKPRVPVRRPTVARPGYCENCRVKYEDMMDHVKSPQHRRFASNERNWFDLDTLLDNVKRPVCKQSPDMAAHHALYALSSDDVSHDVSSVAASALPSLNGTWAGTAFAADQFGHPSLSAHMMASGRLSTEMPLTATTTTTDGGTAASNASRPAPSIIDLTFSNPHSNSSCASPGATNDEKAELTQSTADVTLPPITPLAQRGNCGINNNRSSSTAALVSYLETPQFRNQQVRNPYDDAATLVGLGTSRESQYQSALETPTQSAKHVDLMRKAANGSTLVQPTRVLPKFCTESSAETLPGTTISAKSDIANRLCNMIHGESEAL